MLPLEKNRINSLRTIMLGCNIDGYLVPSTDEFNNEYVPNYARRLEWLTGFSGSNGMAFITHTGCYLFTDGRYMLQAVQELVAGFEILPLSMLMQVLPLNKRIGVDPMLHTYKEVELYKQRGIEIMPLVDNLVDIIWQDKDIPSTGGYYQFDNDKEDRINRICAAMHSTTDNLLICVPDQVCWLAGIRGDDVEFTPIACCYGVLSREGELQIFKDHHSINSYLRHNEGVIQLDPQQTPYAIANVIKPECRLLCNSPIDEIRLVKSEVDIENIKLAHIYDGVAICNFLHWFAEQTNVFSEYELSERLLSFRQKMPQFHSPSFATICGFAANGAVVHYHPSVKNSHLIEGDGLLLIDSGGQYKIGTTDITRVLPIGEINPIWKTHYTAVLQCHIELATASFPYGATGAQLDGISRAPLWAHGLDYPHGTGHGVGLFLSVHEGPLRISKACQHPLVKGAILSNEPGVYFAAQYGIRLENLMVVIEDANTGFLGFETLSLVPFDNRLINKSMLNKKQSDWLASYHNKVLTTLHPHLSAPVRTWLQQQCSSLDE